MPNLTLNLNQKMAMASAEDSVITTPPEESLDFVPLTPCNPTEKDFLSTELTNQLMKTNQYHLWVDSTTRKSITSFDAQEVTWNNSWLLAWRRSDRGAILLGSLEKSGTCELKDVQEKPVAVVQRFDKKLILKKNSNIGWVKTMEPENHEIVTVEQLAEGQNRILQLHIHHPFNVGAVRIIKIEPSSAKCICCFLCSRSSKFELTISDGCEKIGSVSGSIEAGERTPLPAAEGFPMPFLLMNVNFDQSVDPEVKFFTLSGLLVGAIQQVFSYFDPEWKTANKNM